MPPITNSTIPTLLERSYYDSGAIVNNGDPAQPKGSSYYDNGAIVNNGDGSSNNRYNNLPVPDTNSVSQNYQDQPNSAGSYTGSTVPFGPASARGTHHGANAGAIAGGVIGGVVGLVALFLLYRYIKNMKTNGGGAAQTEGKNVSQVMTKLRERFNKKKEGDVEKGTRTGTASEF
ncbi:MAG: hypothetical protein Q9213_005110 [Squamulea squamosa]